VIDKLAGSPAAAAGAMTSPARALVALPRDGEREAATRLLHLLGCDVDPVADTVSLLDAAKREPVPDLVLVDIDRPATDAVALLKVLARYPSTRTTAVVLVAPPEVDERRLAALTAASPFAILRRPLRRGPLESAVGDALARAVAARERAGALLSRPEKSSRASELNNSLLVHEVRCRFHAQAGPGGGEPFERYVLRARRIETEQSVFDLPVYKSAARGADFVDYNLLAVTVCPHCLFASVDPGQFDDPAERGDRPVYPAATAKALAAREPDRRAIAAAAGPTLFSHDRTYKDALVAYALAIDCANTIYEANKYTQQIELLRLANYHLRLRCLHETHGAPPDTTRTAAVSAADWLRKSFLYLAGAPLYRATYQLIATSIWLGDDRSAHQYLSKLDELHHKVFEVPVDKWDDEKAAVQQAERSAVDRYRSRAQEAWADRDLHRAKA
jgi:CheY-like chemotaxis protein